MIPKIFTATPTGYHATVVEIETDVSNGLPTTIIVGLPDTMVQESRERIRSAIRNTGFQYPVMRVAINLAPSNIPKVGSHFDLAIGLSVLLAGGLIEFDPSQKMFIGELALDGRLRPTSGILSMVMAAKAVGIKQVFVPKINSKEAALLSGIEIYGVETLQQIVRHLRGEELISVTPHVLEVTSSEQNILVDFCSISGQLQAKRALLIAASGFHNVRFMGSPGSGKTMLAKALAGILPIMTEEEILQTTNLHSLAGILKGKIFISRPFRAPHHTASSIALIGGGATPKPGEVSLAHNGVLFLDELPEFQKNVLEVMRQPLEEYYVTVSRAKFSATFPARFILVTAQNPCRCGNYGDPMLSCSCHPSEVIKYNKKISGPLLDRIDLHVQVPRMRYAEFKNSGDSVTSAQMRCQVMKARGIQFARYQKCKYNSEMDNTEVKQHCRLDQKSEELLEKAANTFLLSGRSINRILKVSRTIADLDSSEKILTKHLAEALQYRLPVD